MKRVLYFNRAELSTGMDCNKGIEAVLAEAQKFGLELVETSKMPAEELRNEYGRAIIPSVWKKYRIRQIFGSRRHSGFMFGRNVPALLIENDAQGTFPEDVYPHEKDGRIVTIYEFLTRPVQ
jgi:hypothetical protein